MSSPAHQHADFSQANVLLIGADGMLGHAWSILLKNQNINFRPTTLQTMDITSESDIQKHLTPDTTHVINCAAWTDVDGAEEKEELATQVNGHAVGKLAQQCCSTGALFIHYSTDYIFNGHGSEPYSVDAPTDPVNAYGRSKLVGEQLLKQSGCDYLLIRSSWLYAPWGKNFVETIAKLAQTRDQLKVVNDQRGRPASCEYLAERSYQLIAHNATGDYHLNDGGECTWFDFASEIVKLTGAQCEVSPCTSEEFPRPAKRPAYSVMDLSKTEALIGPSTHWKTCLKQVTDRLDINAQVDQS